jgi:excisionase family DNA binding protein
MHTKKNLRLAEFARLVGYEVSTVRKKIHRREIDSIKVGRIVLIPESEVDRLLKDYRPRIEAQCG